MTERIVVGSERQVERLARESVVAETRAALEKRLLAELCPEVELAGPETAKMALAAALRDVASSDPLLASVARAGEKTWTRTVDALHAALGVLHAAIVDDRVLASAAKAPGIVGARARTLRAALSASAAALAKVGLLDARAAGAHLARALGKASPDAVVAAARAPRLLARGVVSWSAADVAWWRALDLALARRGGGARVALPAFERSLDASRERDPLELLADELARAFDDAPVLERIDAPLGDLRFSGPAPADAGTRVSVVRASDASAQARAVADAVHAALEGGTPLDRIAIGVPVVSEETLGPLRRALEDAGIVAHDVRGPAPLGAGLVAVAIEAIGIAEAGYRRADVAVLLRSRYLDARALTKIPDRHEATTRLLEVGRALEETPTARADEPLAALVQTARSFRARTDEPEDGAAALTRADVAARVGDVLGRAARAKTHAEHVVAAREVFAGLGLGPRLSPAVRAALAHDAPPSGVVAAELAASARDAHAWDVLTAALEEYEVASRRLGLSQREVSGEAFRSHLTSVLEVGAPPLGAARAGTVRTAKLADLAFEDLSLLVVVDANDGALPTAAPVDPLLPEALLAALRDDAAGLGPETLARRRAQELATLALAAAHSERIVVTCRARDEQGAILAPAPLVSWLEKAGVSSAVRRATRLSDRPLSARDARLSWLSAWPGHATDVAPHAARRAEREARREAYFFDTRRVPDDAVGRLDGDEALTAVLREETGSERPIAVTSLERIAMCPFLGYAQAVLGARDRAPRGELPDAREEGTLVHAALAAAFRATAELWRARPRDAGAIERAAFAAVERLLEGELVGSPLRDVTLSRAKDSVRAVLGWSLAEERWDFAVAEQSFGDSTASAWPALVLEDGEDRLVLRGTIDRVDVGHLEANVRAIDYKRSKRTATDVAGLGETSLQVPIYALAALRALDRARAEGMYLPTGARDLPADYRPKDAFAKRWAELVAREDGLAAVERTALGLVLRVRAGDVAPAPHKESACLECAARGGCRKPRFAVAPEEEAES